MIKKKEVNVEKIIIKYEDGTEKEITKGAVVNIAPGADDEETTLNFEFTGFSGNDLITFVYGVVEMGVKAGMFNDHEDKE